MRKTHRRVRTLGQARGASQTGRRISGLKALYKTNFEPLEWYDGSIWSRDLRLLKEKSRQE